MALSSPTDEIFPWVSPECDPLRSELPMKRKCDGDSGYMSVSPASGGRGGSARCVLMTPDISSNPVIFCNGSDNLYTPAGKVKSECVGKRLLESSSCEKPLSLPSTPEANTSDLMDTSLYCEPMDISMIKPNSHLDMIAEESLNVSEISGKIPVNLSIGSRHSGSASPSPMRCATPCDRLYRSSSSLKASRSSSKKKKVFLKKKLPRPGAMIGSEFIDFLAHLGVRANFMFIAWNIMDLLSGEDISNMTMVSKTWRNICFDYPRAKEKWTNYVRDRKLIKENLPRNLFDSAKKLDSSSDFEHGLSRNHYAPFRMKQPVSPPVSPSKFRFHLFQKEAARLKEDEKLTDCPKCSLPSIVSPAARLGRCTRLGCGLEFCSSCKSPYHGARPCTTSTPASPQRPQQHRRLVGSKESKRFLRRL